MRVTWMLIYARVATIMRCGVRDVRRGVRVVTTDDVKQCGTAIIVGSWLTCKPCVASTE
jgi:hypothetical protein